MTQTAKATLNVSNAIPTTLCPDVEEEKTMPGVFPLMQDAVFQLSTKLLLALLLLFLIGLSPAHCPTF